MHRAGNVPSDRVNNPVCILNALSLRVYPSGRRILSLQTEFCTWHLQVPQVDSMKSVGAFTLCEELGSEMWHCDRSCDIQGPWLTIPLNGDVGGPQFSIVESCHHVGHLYCR
jgi:hypothetical protein